MFTDISYSTKTKKLICIEDELKLLESYFFVAKTRLGKNLLFDIDIKDRRGAYLPPLAIQLLVENAIKHNVINNENKLYLNIFQREYSVYVENKGLKKIHSSVEKNIGTGLKNLRDRFSYVTDKKIKIIEEKERFCVKIPLIYSKSIQM